MRVGREGAGGSERLLVRASRRLPLPKPNGHPKRETLTPLPPTDYQKRLLFVCLRVVFFDNLVSLCSEKKRADRLLPGRVTGRDGTI